MSVPSKLLQISVAKFKLFSDLTTLWLTFVRFRHKNDFVMVREPSGFRLDNCYVKGTSVIMVKKLLGKG